MSKRRFERTLLPVLACALLAWPQARPARAAPLRCPPQTEMLVASAWKAYRADSTLAALDRFDRAERLCPIDLDAKVGLGYANLRLGYLARAESLFTRVALLDPTNTDGWDGLMRAAYRLGDNIEALRAARHCWQLHPGDPDVKLVLDRLYPGWERPAPGMFKRPDSLVVPARAARERFEVPGPGGWTPLYVKGVQFGVVLPGSSANEFPADSARYAGWLESIAGMNANAVRLATLLPPDFYRALAAWNGAHPQQTLWLIQGVRAGAPPAGDFGEPRWLGGVRQETRDVVDAVHGAAAILARPGHARGRYDADVSRWTLAWIFGRQWDAVEVRAWDAEHPGRHMHGGRYLALADGGAMDAWLAARCDELAGYEAGRYNTLHPIAYASTPALDRSPQENPNDPASLDPSRVHPTDADPAGWFASVHVDPFDPEVVASDPDAAGARSPEGRSSYFAYLRDLGRRHGGLAVLIDGYGVPSSRGNTRPQPQGWTEGGHDESAQALIDARLTREIRASGCAGGVLSEWMDQWWRRNPAVMDLEVPGDRAGMWHNAMDPDQHYGILAMDAGAVGASPELGGDPARWRALPVFQRAAGTSATGSPVALGVGSDASCVYLAVALAGMKGRAFGWDSLGVTLALDTWRADLGQRTLSAGLAGGDIGFEFEADLTSPANARWLVTPDYDATGQGGRLRRFPIVPLARDDGAFDDLGRLRYGALRRSSLADWTYDAAAGLLEVRLPWGLLNVTDPSWARVLCHDREGRELGSAAGDGFRIGVITWRKGEKRRPVGALPALGPGRRWSAADFTAWSWAPWESPEFHERLKPVYQALKVTWGSMPDQLATEGSAR